MGLACCGFVVLWGDVVCEYWFGGVWMGGVILGFWSLVCLWASDGWFWILWFGVGGMLVGLGAVFGLFWWVLGFVGELRGGVFRLPV